MKTAVVTGASTGIGYASVAALIESGWRVFGSVRKQTDADRLKADFPKRFTPLLFDVTDDEAVKAAVDVVANDVGDSRIQGLVNNAGIAVADPLLVQELDVFRQHLEVNVIGALRVTQAFAPLLGADENRKGPKGRIVNVASVAGSIGFPFLGAYCASKHALEGMSESLRRELMRVGIDVSIVSPGNTATEIWDKADEQTTDHLEGTVWKKPADTFVEMFIKGGRSGFAAAKVAESIREALEAKSPKARYLPVHGKLQNYTLPTTLPARVVDKLVAGQVGLKPDP